MLKLAIVLAAVAVSYVQAQNEYYLYTKNNLDVPEILKGPGNDLIATTQFDPAIKTLILVHGHGESLSAQFNTKIKDELLTSEIQEPHNVIVCDWSADARHSYAVASGLVPSVARRLTQFTEWLKTERPALRVGDLHLVGFGLGAHVVGMAARNLPKTIGEVGRITGLDPAGSRWGTNSGRLEETDAKYVEVIHTDGSGLLAYGSGVALGRINFYANGGSNQPGCFTHSCSHNRVWDLFAASMTNTQLLGYPCSTNTQLNLNLCRGHPLLMGGTEFSKVGVKQYRVNTRRSWPF